MLEKLIKIAFLFMIANFVIITDKHRIIAAESVTNAMNDDATKTQAVNNSKESEIQIARTQLQFENNGKFKSANRLRNERMLQLVQIM